MGYESMDLILAAREARWSLRKELSRSYGKPVLSLSMTVPGPNKSAPGIFWAIKVISDEVEKTMGSALSRRIDLDGADGPSVHWVVDLSGKELKKRALAIEESHGLGRIVDLDVLDENGAPLGRSELGFPPRRCLICDRPAKECSYCRRHGLSELLEEIEGILEKSGWRE
ncbi:MULTISPECIES: citrate lyase holo-[acyl-carrier protein] synthase [Dethiosulfovibrio]|uniref:citrate lyase holo-[acyl-carrier protein] synthase n=2 Tax=Dethiosulfovibrio TaxID=47054 RepID=A0ABS9EQG2_9BACT|nr:MULTISPECIES: citrate lyase holo-[acyl-carrier protein] synthase [Dethiosulfovibrio]MCF4114979.1 citrate lyase holo-[acyl-carrier protein] synthase [Dethiosulfovibrio russensis]MCF4143421.1 citrate lyase holo-[acyl-carrier protein] synthase [Dethiosulfovibrio marinus]MCF4145937.1 citrate lyase holo-[acyl-carrier protein] synthase [Dethiosulfovibrio acidaminovorans]